MRLSHDSFTLQLTLCMQQVSSAYTTPMARVHAGRAMQARNTAVSEEASFSHASSHTAPGKRSSRKSVGGSALRVLSDVTQVHTLTDVYSSQPSLQDHNCQVSHQPCGPVCCPDMLSSALCCATVVTACM